MGKQDHLLREIESQWPAHIARGLSELIRAHPGEQIYAAAFWQFYCDYTVIHPPAFGANAEQSLKVERYRWAPPEWRWDILNDVFDSMLPIYLQLSESLAGASDGDWEAVIAAHYELIPRVARSVTEAARSRSGDFRGLSLPDRFLVFAVDVTADAETYNQLVRASVDKVELATLQGLAPEE